MVITKVSNEKNPTIFYLYEIWHAQSLIVFAVSIKLEILDFETSGGVAHHLQNIYIYIYI